MPHTKTFTRLASALALTAMAGCAGMSQQDKNTAIGAGVGAIGGSVLTGGSAAGAIGGAAVGGVIGAGLLLVTPARIFTGLVPWLLLLATVLFAAGPVLGKRNSGQGHPAWRLPGLLGVAIYGGYFNGGLGILLMALYTLTGESRLNTVNALKNLNSFVLSLLSVLAFALAGAIVWSQAIWMMVLATAGGWAGARMAKRLPIQWVRWLVIATGLAMSAVFFQRS